MAKQQSKPEASKPVAKAEYVIASDFRDKADYAKLYVKGDKADFDAARLQYLIGLGLVKQL